MKRLRTLTPETVAQLTRTVGPWLSCDDCFDQVDTIVDELILHGVPMKLRFSAHLRGCPACREETRALVELVALDEGVNPTERLAEFDAITSAR